MSRWQHKVKQTAGTGGREVTSCLEDADKSAVIDERGGRLQLQSWCNGIMTVSFKFKSF